MEREVWIKAGHQSLDVTLLPTAEHLADYVQGAKTQRLWGFVTLGAGAALAAGSGGFLLWNRGQKRDAERAFDDYADAVARTGSGECPDDDCERQLGILVDELDARRQRDLFGWIGLSVGAVALGGGAFLLWRAPDPGRYDPKPESDVFGRLDLSVHPNGLRLTGSF